MRYICIPLFSLSLMASVAIQAIAPTRTTSSNPRLSLEATLEPLVDDISNVKEARDLLNFYDSVRQAKKLTPPLYLKDLMTHTLSLLKAIPASSLYSDRDSAKYQGFLEQANKASLDVARITAGDVMRMLNYLNLRLVDKTDQLLARLAVNKRSLSLFLEDEIFNGFYYNHDKLLDLAKIPRSANVQTIVFELSRYLASAILNKNFSTQRLLIGGLNSIFFSRRELAFALNIDSLTSLPPKSGLALQVGVIYNFVYRQQALFRIITSRQTEFTQRYGQAKVKAALDFSFALQITNGLWQNALDNAVLELKTSNPAQHDEIIASLTKLFGANRENYPATMTVSDDDLNQFFTSFGQ